MKRIIILTISLIGTLALTSCGVKNVKVKVRCEGGSAHPTTCEEGVSGTFNKSASDGSFDANLASIDLSSSSVSLTSNTGNMVITVKNASSVTVASSVFGWYAAGDVIYPSNPTQMSNWVNANVLDGFDMVFDIDNIDTTGSFGNNTFTVFYNYGSSSVGASDSFYLNNADLNGF